MPEALNPGGEAGTEALQAVLSDLNATKDVEVAMVVTQDGLTLAAQGKVSDADRLGALSAGLLALCRDMAQELQRGEMEQVLLHGGTGLVLLRLAGPVAMLAIMARPDCNLGLLLLEAERAALAIGAAL